MYILTNSTITVIYFNQNSDYFFIKYFFVNHHEIQKIINFNVL